MNVDTRLRVGLWFLVVSGVMVGAWAQFFPQAFYDSFPGLGRSWVSVDGPFNEHLARDVGGLYLALSAVTLIAIFAQTRETVLAAALGWLVSQIPALRLPYDAFARVHFDARQDRECDYAGPALSWCRRMCSCG